MDFGLAAVSLFASGLWAQSLGGLGSSVGV